MATEDDAKTTPHNHLSRRDMLKGASAGAGAVAALGTNRVDGMKQMLKWHLDAFVACPIGERG